MDISSPDKNMNKAVKTKKNVIAQIFTILLMLVLALSFLSFWSDVNTTVEYDFTWKVSAGIITVVFLGTMIASIITNKQTLNIKGGIIKKSFMLLAGLFGLSILMIFSVFSGVPTALHYLDNKNGSMEVTVLKKIDKYSKRKCSPRLTIKEFTFFTKDHICPGKETFNVITEGSRIKLIGTVSKYGIEAKQVQWLTRN